MALPANHPLARHRRVRLCDLREETWIEGGHPDCLGPLSQLANALGGPPRIGFFCEDWNGKQALVAGGSGIMLVPTLAQDSAHPGIVLRPTSPSLPRRRLYAATPSPPFRLPAVTAMLNVLTGVSRKRGGDVLTDATPSPGTTPAPGRSRRRTTRGTRGAPRAKRAGRADQP